MITGYGSAGNNFCVVPDLGLVVVITAEDDSTAAWHKYLPIVYDLVIPAVVE